MYGRTASCCAGPIRCERIFMLAFAVYFTDVPKVYSAVCLYSIFEYLDVIVGFGVRLMRLKVRSHYAHVSSRSVNDPKRETVGRRLC